MTIKTQSILVVRLSSFGDILHTATAVQALKRWNPQMNIGWLVQSPFHTLVRYLQGIDRVHILHTPWFIPRKLSQAYDMTIDFQGLMKSAFVSRFVSAKKHVGFHKSDLREKLAFLFYTHTLQWPYLKDETGLRQTLIRINHLLAKKLYSPEHVIFKNLTLLKFTGFPIHKFTTYWSPRVDFKEDPKAAIIFSTWLKKKKLEPNAYIVVHISAGWPSKKWPLVKWEVLIKHFAYKLGIPVVVTWGFEDEKNVRELQKKFLPRTPVYFTPKWSWDVFIPLLKESRAVIGCDTGLTHLGAAFGKPVIFLMGPTDPDRNGPWRWDIQTTFYHKIECGPCMKKQCVFLHECMELISPEHVAGTLASNLELLKIKPAPKIPHENLPLHEDVTV